MPVPGGRPELASEAGFARQLLRQRRQRDAILGKDLFGDASWDMMLDLFVSEIEGHRVAMSSLVQATVAPQSTALRRMAELVQAGILEREPDTTDGRRTFIRLAPPTFDKLAGLIRGWMAQAGQLLGE